MLLQLLSAQSELSLGVQANEGLGSMERHEGQLLRGTMLNDQLCLQTAGTLLQLMRADVSEEILKTTKLYPIGLKSDRANDTYRSSDDALVQIISQAMMSVDLSGDLSQQGNQIVRPVTFRAITALLLTNSQHGGDGPKLNTEQKRHYLHALNLAVDNVKLLLNTNYVRILPELLE
jgi:hypothetical protein